MTVIFEWCKIKNIRKKEGEKMPNTYEVEYTVHKTYTARVEASSDKEAIQKVRKYETFDVTETDCDGPYSILVSIEW